MKKFALIAAIAALPKVAFAQATLGDILTIIGDLILQATPIVVALALLFFFWGLALFILAAGEEEARSRGRNIMIWGILALFVIVSVFDIIQIFDDTFGIEQGGDLDSVPSVPLSF